MADQYADAINEATVAISHGMQLAPNDDQYEIWKSMLDRLACIEDMEKRRARLHKALAAVKAGA